MQQVSRCNSTVRFVMGSCYQGRIRCSGKSRWLLSFLHAVDSEHGCMEAAIDRGALVEKSRQGFRPGQLVQGQVSSEMWDWLKICRCKALQQSD